MDMRGAEEEWHGKPSADTTHGCTCVDDLCADLAEVWGKGTEWEEVSINIDTAILRDHFFSTWASGPILRLIIDRPESHPDPSSPPPAKRTRHSKSKSPESDTIILESLSKYILHRVRHAKEHKGGRMSVFLPRSEDGPDPDVDALVSGMIAGAESLAEEGEAGLFKAPKGKAMLRGITVEVGDGSNQDA